MQAGRYASLLPELFRYKTTKVRIFQPQFILIDFHGTISERKWEDKVIFPYVKKELNNFLKENITEQEIQNCIASLKNESFEQRFTHKYDDVPIIDDIIKDSTQTTMSTTIANNNNNNLIDEISSSSYELIHLANQMSDFILWQLNMRKETKETHLIQRLIWLDGFKKKKIFTPLFEDVFRCIKKWHDLNNCKIFIISSIDADTLKLLFENTDKGNLNQYLAGYVSAKKAGDKMLPEIYKTFYEKLCCQLDDNNNNVSPCNLDCSSSNPNPNSKSTTTTTLTSSSLNSRAKSYKDKEEPQTTLITSTKNSNNIINKQKKTNNKSQQKEQQQISSPSGTIISKSSLSSQSSEIFGKPILFLTDSGQEAKASSQVADGLAYECLLVNRPKNKRFRTYYLSQFAYIDKFDDIDFV